jgi:hypothetical protein
VDADVALAAPGLSISIFISFTKVVDTIKKINRINTMSIRGDISRAAELSRFLRHLTRHLHLVQ